MKITVQTGGLYENWGAEETCRLIKEAGFDGIDWGIDKVWSIPRVNQKILDHCIFEDSMDDIMEFHREELEAIKKYNLEIIQGHAPFPAYVKNFPEFNGFASKICKKCIQFADIVGMKYLVVHGISHFINDDTQTPESIKQLNMQFYESMIPELLESNVVVCLENLFTHYGRQIIEGTCSNADEAIEYIDSLNEKAGKECFALCLDSGHLNLLGKRPSTYIHKLGGRIKAIHLSDNKGTEDSHQAPYTGSIIWRDLLNALGDIGYEGSINFETFGAVKNADKEVIPLLLSTIHGLGENFAERISARSAEK